MERHSAIKEEDQVGKKGTSRFRGRNVTHLREVDERELGEWDEEAGGGKVRSR